MTACVRQWSRGQLFKFYWLQYVRALVDLRCRQGGICRGGGGTGGLFPQWSREKSIFRQFYLHFSSIFSSIFVFIPPPTASHHK